ncbi:hypothetical protein BASA50_011048 [Batrachochytrium salamandrivorans]|uniref:Guanylate cyclase domain-containing protein n=1 Tax=Batrachochytrium salamandrivorans TaxID=1357716 RepID=A0ABQ8EX78_9FUNG|nr:hypothetical protein BASA50_011048 [Batrachochytrium salamandrivorans]
MGSNTILNPYRPSQARRKSTSTPVLPKLGTGPLNLQFSNSPAVIPSAGIESTLLDPQESIHSFVQHTWAKFASMPDAHRNMLLKGIISHCSTKQTEMICTSLNLRNNNTDMLPPKMGQVYTTSDLPRKYTATKQKNPPNTKPGQHQGGPNRTIQRKNTLDETAQNTSILGTVSGSSSSDGNNYMNSNMYIKLLNSSIDPDLIFKQLLKANPEGVRFLTAFLSSRCKKLQAILQTMYDISLEIEVEKAMAMLLQCILDATESKYACLYFTGVTVGKLVVRSSNWIEPRACISVDEVFAGPTLFKGGQVNIYNAKTSEHYTDAISEAYQQVDADCVLSAPVFGDGMKVSGIIEVINKQSGNPFFNVEDEFMIKALASLGTLLFNQTNVKLSAIKKTDDIKLFLNTASMMATEKADMGDLLQVIMQAARELVSADRCTLLMLDKEKEELCSTVAQGYTEIRFPMSKGIAGHVVMTGETLNIQNAYTDSRFNRDVDMHTGYHTRNILCVPMLDQHQKIIGVAEMINKLPDDTHFTKEDEAQLSSFSSLAASTIEKQLAFKKLHDELQEMIRLRTYMISILQSINSVVISLNDDGRLVSINNAECMNFSQSLTSMRLTSFEHWLGHENSQLVSDIMRVQTTSMPISGRNYPFKLGNNPTRYINYSIQKLSYDYEVDRQMEVQVPRSSGRTGDPNRQSLQEEDISSFPHITGVLLVLDEITPQSSLEETLGRQMPSNTVHRIIDDQYKLNGEKQKVTVLVADIRGFTATTDGLAPHKIVDYLNNFYEVVAIAVQSEGGVLNKISGDSATVVFGLPYPSPDDTYKAVKSALKIRQAIDDLNKKHEMNELPGIRVGIGLATGSALCAAIGPPRLQEYTIVGEPVLLAHRLEEIALVYGVSIMSCEITRADIKDRFHTREIDIAAIRGIRNTIPLFEIMASSDHDLNHDVMTTLICFELGLSEYRAKNWQAAVMHFKKAISLSDDRPPRTLIERCKGLIDGKYEVSDDWDGVWRLN